MAGRLAGLSHRRPQGWHGAHLGAGQAGWVLLSSGWGCLDKGMGEARVREERTPIWCAEAEVSQDPCPPGWMQECADLGGLGPLLCCGATGPLDM